MKEFFAERRRMWQFFLVVACVAAGWAGHVMWKIYSPDNVRGKIIREGARELINPILSCEIGTKNVFIELRPIEEKLNKAVERALDEGKAKDISVYVRMMNSGRWIGINEDAKYVPASLMKVLVMMAYLKTAENDSQLLSQRITYAHIDPLDLRPPGLELGMKYSVETLIRKMIVDSNNSALYLLADNLPLNSLKEVFDDLNLKLPASQREGEIEYMSPKTYSLVFRVLYGASYLSREMSEKALEFLAGTSFKDGIVTSLLPSLTVAHKFGVSTVLENGSTFRELHDCGIVYYPEHPYLLCVMTKGRDVEDLKQVIGNVSTVTYQEVGKFFQNGG